MASQSLPSTPSEGEIVESGSEKATTSLHTVTDNNVNPQSRHRASVSRSPSLIRSPVQSPKSFRSRTRSRSPYREPRGEKRPRGDDHYNDRPREDTRRFKVRYEDRPGNDRRNTYKAYDLDRSNGSDSRLSYDDRYEHTGSKRHRIRSRSPYSKSAKPSRGQGGGKERNGGRYGRGLQDQGRRGHEESHKGLSHAQSVSDRGYSPVATAFSRQTAETRHDQKHANNKPESSEDQFAAEYVRHL